MCGIAGIVTPRALGARELSGLSAMRAALRHRGPDGEGEWRSACGAAALAHTRLAIFDPTAAAGQPMSTEDGRFTIAYNGAIYNFAQLRRALEQRGTRFVSNADTEVVLRLYQERGAAALSDLQGMFALAIWDAATRTCVLARDPFGIKPLYYAAGGGRLLFASELRALLRSGLIAADLDPAGLYGFFRTGSVPEPRTLLRDVKCVPAGHVLTWTSAGMVSDCYWQLRFANTGDASVEATRCVLADSVASHLAGDAPAGVFLSGGVDSSAILALSQAAGRRGVKTFCLSFPGTAHDEGPQALRTAQHFGAEHHACEMDSAGARRAFSEYLAATDQPSVDGLNTFVMSRFARQHGVKVVLSGIGADELFGGYPTFTGVPRLAQWHERFRWTGALGARLGRLAESAARDTRTRRVADMLSRAPSLDNAYQTFRGIFTHHEAVDLARGYLAADDDQFAAAADDGADAEPANAVTRFELTRYVRNQLLRDGDVMSMASGVELRTPFLSTPVVEHLARMPAAVRVEPRKSLLWRAVPELPPWIADQPKRCFQFPFAQWMDEEWREMLSPVPRNGAFAGTWYRRWCMFVMESWMAQVRQAADV
jgi:asparagine synthase (glutamine-hydrolysing)